LPKKKGGGKKGSFEEFRQKTSGKARNISNEKEGSKIAARMKKSHGGGKKFNLGFFCVVGGGKRPETKERGDENSKRIERGQSNRHPPKNPKPDDAKGHGERHERKKEEEKTPGGERRPMVARGNAVKRGPITVKRGQSDKKNGGGKRGSIRGEVPEN